MKMSPTAKQQNHHHKLSTLAMMKVPRIIVFAYSALRLFSCAIHNIYCIPGYLFVNLIQWPLYYLSLKTYSKIENFLYYSLLYIVGWWSYGCGVVVHEHGDDIHELHKDPKVRALLIANHQSTGDVPLMFQAFASTSEWKLLWVMDKLFKWTNFGLVSQVHGDYFINTQNYIPDSILNHCLKPYSSHKDMIIIFPEGGFRYKRHQSSLSFGTKRNYPALYNVTYPRVNGFRELLNKDLNITHVVDLTICYDDRDDVPSILDVVCGIRFSEVHFYYKIHKISETPNIHTEEWLYEQWHKKEALLANHYVQMKQLRNGFTTPNTNGNTTNSFTTNGSCTKDPEDSRQTTGTIMKTSSGDHHAHHNTSTTLRKREKSDSPTPPVIATEPNLMSNNNKLNNNTMVNCNNCTNGNLENHHGNGVIVANHHLNHNHQNVLNHNQSSNNNHHQQNGTIPMATKTLKFRCHEEFQSLRFDINEGRPVKLNFLKVIAFHGGYIFLCIMAYASFLAVWNGFQNLFTLLL